MITAKLGLTSIAAKSEEATEQSMAFFDLRTY